MRPFCLCGQFIRLFRHEISYTTPEGVKQTDKVPYTPDEVKERARLEATGCTEITFKSITTAGLEWLDGIDVGEEMSMEKAIEIWQMGEAAYTKSKNQPTVEDYLIDLDFRVSKTELGI